MKSKKAVLGVSHPSATFRTHLSNVIREWRLSSLPMVEAKELCKYLPFSPAYLSKFESGHILVPGAEKFLDPLIDVIVQRAPQAAAYVPFIKRLHLAFLQNEFLLADQSALKTNLLHAISSVPITHAFFGADGYIPAAPPLELKTASIKVLNWKKTENAMERCIIVKQLKAMGLSFQLTEDYDDDLFSAYFILNFGNIVAFWFSETWGLGFTTGYDQVRTLLGAAKFIQPSGNNEQNQAPFCNILEDNGLAALANESVELAERNVIQQILLRLPKGKKSCEEAANNDSNKEP